MRPHFQLGSEGGDEEKRRPRQSANRPLEAVGCRDNHNNNSDDNKILADVIAFFFLPLQTFFSSCLRYLVEFRSGNRTERKRIHAKLCKKRRRRTIRKGEGEEEVKKKESVAGRRILGD